MTKKQKRKNKNFDYLDNLDPPSNCKGIVRKKVNSNLSNKALISVHEEDGKIMVNQKERV